MVHAQLEIAIAPHVQALPLYFALVVSACSIAEIVNADGARHELQVRGIESQLCHRGIPQWAQPETR